MISEKQKRILAFPYTHFDTLICDGAIRSGKTSIMMWAFVDWAMREFNGQLFGICGKTVDSASKNIIVPFITMTLAQERYILVWHKSEKVLEVRRGKTANRFEVFGGKDESSFALIQGRTLAGVLLDEVVLMPESFVNQALARCSVDGARMWFSCNPGSPHHWFHEKWVQKADEKNALYLHFEMSDNPSLSEKTLQRYESMYSGVFYDWYVKGLWVTAEGLIYPMFTPDNVVDEIPDGAEYYISCDYGTHNPFSAGLWSWDGKTATRIREYYYSGRDTQAPRTDEEHYEQVEALAGNLPIKRIVIDPSAASFIEVIRRHKRFTVIRAQNDVINGISTVARYLQDGTIKIHRSCKDAIREFGEYAWDDKSTEDKPVKASDHCLTGDTLVDTVDGAIPIKDLVGKTGKVYCTDGEKVKAGQFHNVRMTQSKAVVYEIELDNGKKVKATAEHPILTERGWVAVKDLRNDDKIACIGG